MIWLAFAFVLVFARHYLHAPWWAIALLVGMQLVLLGMAAITSKLNRATEQLEELVAAAAKPINLHVQVGDEPERFIPIWRAGDDDVPFDSPRIEELP